MLITINTNRGKLGKTKEGSQYSQVFRIRRGQAKLKQIRQ